MADNQDEGYLYCLYNKCFNEYGDNVYKLGRTKNLKQRLNHYTTGYIDASIYVHISNRKFKNSKKAESILFFILRNYRVRQRREFFNTTEEKIIYTMDRLSSLLDETLDRIYKKIILRICPMSILEDIDDEEEDKWYKKSIEFYSTYDEFFEKYKFKPKNAKLYKNLIKDEDCKLQILTS